MHPITSCAPSLFIHLYLSKDPIQHRKSWGIKVRKVLSAFLSYYLNTIDNTSVCPMTRLGIRRWLSTRHHGAICKHARIEVSQGHKKEQKLNLFSLWIFNGRWIVWTLVDVWIVSGLYCDKALIPDSAEYGSTLHPITALGQLERHNWLYKYLHGFTESSSPSIMIQLFTLAIKKDILCYKYLFPLTYLNNE